MSTATQTTEPFFIGVIMPSNQIMYSEKYFDEQSVLPSILTLDSCVLKRNILEEKEGGRDEVVSLLTVNMVLEQ